MEKEEFSSESIAASPFGETVTGNEKKLCTFLIAGQIEGHSRLAPSVKSTCYEHLIPRLVAAEEDERVCGVLFLIHTVGGDVEAGLAMAEMIRGMKKNTASLVLGGGHSIGIPLAVAAKRSFIVPSATMTVHPVRIGGPVLEASQSYSYLKRMQERITDFIVENSKISKTRFDALLHGRQDMATDIGTLLSGTEAVEEGLIDALASFSQVLAHLRKKEGEKGFF